jgi:hypothetical protein
MIMKECIEKCRIFLNEKSDIALKKGFYKKAFSDGTKD